MASIPLPTCSYVSQDPQASCKRLVNCFSEQTDGSPWVQLSAKDSNIPPVVLRRMAGTTQFTGVANTGVGRGAWEMAGVEYVVLGSSLYTLTVSAGAATLTLVAGSSGQITGTGFVRMVDNGACLVILQPGTANCWCYSAGSGFAKITDTFFTSYGAVDCWFIDSYIVFLATNGNTFFNDDGRGVSGNNTITFTTQACFTREFGTDPFVGGTVDHREVLLFGRRTTEGYVNAGNAVGSPFSAAPDTFIQLGCHPDGAYSVANQDQSVFWLANDLTVRRRNGQTPERVSNSGIENVLVSLNKAGTLTGCYALTPTVGGHPFYILTFPNAGRTIVYDCLSKQWAELDSYGYNYWRPLCYHNGLGYQLVGDSQGNGFGYLDVEAYKEFGTQQVVTFTTQPVYQEHNRMSHRRLELVVTAGQVASGANPTASVAISDDGGATWRTRSDTADLGANGSTEARAVWNNLGQSRSRAYQFSIVGDTPMYTVNITTDIQPGKH